jgi:hypothetical protein
VTGFDGRIVEATEGARNCVVNLANVKAGESVLVVQHTNSDLRIGQVIASICREVGAEVDLIIVGEPRDRFGRTLNASNALKAALKAVDVIFANARGVPVGDARMTGSRSVSLRMADIEGFTSPSARLPAEIVFKICELAERQWKNGKTITVTTPQGTNLTAKIVKPAYAFGHLKGPLQPGKFVNWASGFGGLCLWPEWSANGTVCFDTVTTFEGRARTPLKWTVRDGRVVKVEGEPQHVEFIEKGIREGGTDSDHFAEIMIGLNPLADIRFDNMFAGLYMETERHAGVMHCAVGSSTDLEDDQGQTKTPSIRPSNHYDCMNLQPTIKIDDEYSVKDGRLLVVDHPEVQELAAKYGVSF